MVRGIVSDDPLFLMEEALKLLKAQKFAMLDLDLLRAHNTVVINLEMNILYYRWITGGSAIVLPDENFAGDYRIDMGE